MNNNINMIMCNNYIIFILSYYYYSVIIKLHCNWFFFQTKLTSELWITKKNAIVVSVSRWINYYLLQIIIINIIRIGKKQKSESFTIYK